jgi:hypothetical protein
MQKKPKCDENGFSSIERYLSGRTFARQTAISKHVDSMPVMRLSVLHSQGPNWTFSERLFDHFVGRGENRLWDSQAERLGSLEINRHLKFCRLLNRQVTRLFPLEDAINV